MRWQGPRTRVVPLKDSWAQRTLLVCSTAQAASLPGVRSLMKALTEDAH
jgi:hypothetical protein